MLINLFENSITITGLIICLAAALALGILTSLVFLFRSNHSSSFALALALLPMVVALVILLVNGNIGTGVAVAGAFALVRFRSVPGTAREISGIFVSVAIGLALGLGYIGIAALFFVVAALATIILTASHFGGTDGVEKQVRITLPEDLNYDGLFDEVFDRFTTEHELQKIRTTNMGTLYELTYSATFKENQVSKEFIDEIRTRNGNLNIMVGAPEEKETM